MKAPAGNGGRGGVGKLSGQASSTATGPQKQVFDPDGLRLSQRPRVPVPGAPRRASSSILRWSAERWVEAQS